MSVMRLPLQTVWLTLGLLLLSHTRLIFGTCSFRDPINSGLISTLSFCRVVKLCSDFQEIRKELTAKLLLRSSWAYQCF